MWFDIFLSKVDPNQLSFGALVWLVVIATGVFIYKKLWPWLTESYFPARLAQEKARFDHEVEVERERSSTIAAIREALGDLRGIAGAELASLNRLADNSSTFFTAIQLQQQRIVTKLEDEKQRATSL